MHEVLSFNDYMMTRDVILKNIKTGTIDTCFDDSGVPGSKIFDIELGGIYDCKIILFGNEVEEGGGSGYGELVYCKIIQKDIYLGKEKAVQILIGNDIYYVLQRKIKNFMNKDTFWYEYTRKDLIQVNDMVKGDFLPKHRTWL